MKDTYHDHKAVQALAPAVVSASGDGSAVALKGFDSALVVINAGAIVGAGAFSAKLQESDTTTSGDFTDVAAADQIGTLPTVLAENTAYRVGYRGSKKHIRVSVTKASGTSIALSAVAILGHPALAPVA
ncbi:hypothetical protein [Blastochloris viridis]|uniref:Uncharacterized protein n=1 Tax=Blastochloris viridis TaxID=1079 RepID=A0A0H5BJH7_BLAVI|nr:hypothetical protein [Blastochloris viridis]ALK09498.1 hypothetical protein BVIR_1722 [Blastochloris viridis]BAS00617.1 hypothetical protein BV133_3023 [Blastochloris viridis]CUU42161.1 hypothetical protein BVIRIDIS_11670 [Blastochloris viridis]